MASHDPNNIYSNSSAFDITTILNKKVSSLQESLRSISSSQYALTYKNIWAEAPQEYKNNVNSSLAFIKAAAGKISEIQNSFLERVTEANCDLLLTLFNESVEIETALSKAWKQYYEPAPQTHNLAYDFIHNYNQKILDTFKVFAGLDLIHYRLLDIHKLTFSIEKPISKGPLVDEGKVKTTIPEVKPNDAPPIKDKENNDETMQNTPEFQPESDPTPWGLFNIAMNKVPSLKFGLAVAALASLTGTVKSYGIDPLFAVAGVIIILVLMVAVFVFSKVTTSKLQMNGPVKTLTWAFLVLVILTAYALFTSAFFGWPLDLKYVFNKHLPVIKSDTSVNLPSIKKYSSDSSGNLPSAGETNFFLKAFGNIGNLTKGSYVEEGKLKDQLTNLFNYTAFSQDLKETSDWGDMLYALSASSYMIQENRSYFKRTPNLKKEFGNLDNMLTDLRNQIGYGMYSQSLSLFDHWEKYKNNESEFINNLPDRKSSNKKNLDSLNQLRKKILSKIDDIKAI